MLQRERLCLPLPPHLGLIGNLALVGGEGGPSPAHLKGKIPGGLARAQWIVRSGSHVPGQPSEGEKVI